MVGYNTNKEKYSKEELVAELGAMMLCEYFDINAKNKKNSTAYIKGWSEFLKNNINAIITASSKAQKAMEYILDLEHKTEVLEKSA